MNTPVTASETSLALAPVLSWVVTLLVPVALVLAAVRAMMTPVFLRVEYNLPGFPPDPFGFSTQERLQWSQVALDYLTNSADISFLADLRFEDGRPLYNERELEHMVDVKRTVKAALTVWYVSLGLLVALGVWAWRGGWLDAFRHGLARGGWLTMFILAGVLVFVVVGFGVFFVAFHNVFFRPGTWMFSTADTLIRLFPERFWRDIFIYVGALAMVGSLLLAFGLRRR